MPIAQVQDVYPIAGFIVPKTDEKGERTDTPTTVDFEINDVELTEGRPMKVTTVRALKSDVPIPVGKPVTPQPTTVITLPQTTTKTVATISGPFGKLKVPFDDVCVSDVALVLIQSSKDSDYELPTLAEDAALEIMVRGDTYRCLPGITFVRESTGEKHTVMLISEKVANA